MKELEIIEKLNQLNNIHLTFKCIQFSNDEIIEEFASLLTNKKVMIITSLDECLEKIVKAYNEKYDLVLVNEKIRFMLPIVSVVLNDNTEIIKPMIDVLYLLKDNKIIQKVKTCCNKKHSKYIAFKNKEELFLELINRGS